MAVVFAIVLRFFCSSLTDLALMLQRYHLAGIFLHTITVGASVCAMASSVTCESCRGHSREQNQNRETRAHNNAHLLHVIHLSS